MESFLVDFPRIGPHSSGFWKGLLTAMIELGALVGALNQGWIADKYSRKYSIIIAVAIFLVGSILQTAAKSFDMLIVARLVGGIGIGMLSMVTPMYISEIAPPEIRGTLLVMGKRPLTLSFIEQSIALQICLTNHSRKSGVSISHVGLNHKCSNLGQLGGSVFQI